MPNWCYNNIEIFGDDDVLNKIEKKIKSNRTCFDFEKIVSSHRHKLKMKKKWKKLPKKDKEKVSRLALRFGAKFNQWWFSNYGYNWNCRNWGTKWNSNSAYLEKKNGSIHYCFETAWSPPMPVIAKLSKMFNVEVSMFFSCDQKSGDIGFENGDCISEEYHKSYPVECMHYSEWFDIDDSITGVVKCEYCGEDINIDEYKIAEMI